MEQEAMTKVCSVVGTITLKSKKQKLIETEAEIQSLDTRINDLQWQYEFLGDMDDAAPELLTQRRKAIDKKKHVLSEAAKLRTDIMLMEMGVEGD